MVWLILTQATVDIVCVSHLNAIMRNRSDNIYFFLCQKLLISTLEEFYLNNVLGNFFRIFHQENRSNCKMNSLKQLYTLMCWF